MNPFWKDKLLWCALFIDVVSVIDENFFALRDGLEAPDAAAVAEPGVVDEAELGVASILQRVVHLVTQGGTVTQDAVNG